MIKHNGPYYFLLLVFVCAGYLGKAQLKNSTEYNIWSAKPGDTFRVYGRMANLRSSPDIAAMILDSLVCGTKVIIKKQESDLDQVKGIYAPWVNVQYDDVHGTRKDGYLWLGMLALGHFQNGLTHFLYGMERVTAAKEQAGGAYVPAAWYIRAKVIDEQGKVLDEKEVRTEGVQTTVSGGKLLGDMGLKNMNNILRIYFGGEACGIPAYYYYFGWTGSKLLSLPEKMEVADAGVFYHTETFLFPKESGGQPDKIIKLTEEGEAKDETDQKGQPVFRVKKSREVYSWDGREAVKLKALSR